MISLHTAHIITMALSLNWKALSSRIGSSKVVKPKSKKKVIKDVKVEPKIETSLPSLQSLSPLEYALWATEADSTLKVEVSKGQRTVANYNLPKNARKMTPGKYIAIDCEFVGIGDQEESALARVSLVNYFGVVLLDAYVRPKQKVTNWRTWVSGIAPHHMKDAITLEEAHERVKKIVTKDTILVGHAIQNDLKSLSLSHRGSSVRDTLKYSEFRLLSSGKLPALKRLAAHYLQLEIQGGQHSSVEDAQATMALYRMHQKSIEKEWESKFSRREKH